MARTVVGMCVAVALVATACSDSPPGADLEERTSPSPTEAVPQLEPDPYAALATAAQTASSTTAPTLVDGFERAADVAGSSTTDGAVLYAELVTALESHVLSLALSFHAGSTDGWDSAAYRAASATVDTAATRLGDALGQVVGQQQPTRREQLLHEWRAHTAALTDIARDAGEDARQQVDEHLAEVATIVEASTSSRIDADEVERLLGPYVAATVAVAESARDGDPAMWQRTLDAAETVGPTGAPRALAEAVIATAALDGDVEAPATRLLAEVASVLNRDVWLTGAAAVTEMQSTTEPEHAEATRGALDRNTAAIADLVQRVEPGDAGAIGDLWSQQRDELVDLATHVASGGDGEDAAAVIADLNEQLAARIHALVDGELEEPAVASTLEGHTSGIRTAVEAFGNNAAQM